MWWNSVEIKPRLPFHPSPQHPCAQPVWREAPPRSNCLAPSNQAEYKTLFETSTQNPRVNNCSFVALKHPRVERSSSGWPARIFRFFSWCVYSYVRMSRWSLLLWRISWSADAPCRCGEPFDEQWQIPTMLVQSSCFCSGLQCLQTSNMSGSTSPRPGLTNPGLETHDFKVLWYLVSPKSWFSWLQCWIRDMTQRFNDHFGPGFTVLTVCYDGNACSAQWLLVRWPHCW